MPCSNCEEDEVKAKGLCAKCYRRNLKHGTPKLLAKEVKMCSRCGKKKVRAKGFCSNCYARYLKNGSPDRVRVKNIIPCEFCGETRQVHGNGLCKTCYGRAYMNNGDPTPKARRQRLVKACKHCEEIKVIVGKGFCRTCYDRNWKRGTPEYAPKRVKKFCKAVGCDRPRVSHGYCGKHRSRTRDDRTADSAHLKRKFGISIDEYEAILKKQNGVCAICRNPETRPQPSGKPRRLAVDHCHKTGRVRGLLCSNCNTAIGLLNDDPDLITEAAIYLEKHKKAEAPESEVA